MNRERMKEVADRSWGQEKPMVPLNPMVPFLTGWLHGVFDREARQVMKVVAVRHVEVDCFDVALEPGLVLRVHITEAFGAKP